MFSVLHGFFEILLVPLSFLPPAVLTYFNFVTAFFSLFIIGKLLRWVFDILPFV